MDIPRSSAVRNKRLRRSVVAALILIVTLGITVGLSRMSAAAPAVDRATVWIDIVKRGPMVRQVRGFGTLVPEEVRWIPAARDGLIQKVHFRPGAVVKADTVLIDMSSPEVQQSLVDAELQLRGAEADLANTRSQLQNQILNQQAAQSSVESEYQRARLQAEADEELSRDGLVAHLTVKLSKARSEELAAKLVTEKKRLEILSKSTEAQTAAQQARIDQLRSIYELRKNQVSELKVRAGADGVLQELPVEVGQRVAAGAILAKVAEPGSLKAQLKVAETQAKDITVGQAASIDTRNGLITGRVSRVDPAVDKTNGTVAVDVALEGELPKGVRPDLTVDGTIEIERLTDVLYMGRPAFGQANSTVGIFKIMPGGEAVRTQVRLGRGSVNTIEIVEGIQAGDQVILSDMSTWSALDRVKLH
jgi:HlyD family secretion protein